MKLRPFAAAILFGLVAPAAAFADPIPQNVLDQSQQSCQRSCTTAGRPQDQCTAYCTCSVNSIEEKFSAAEYAAMNQAVLAKQPIAQASSDKLTAIVKSCGAQNLK
jgi:hypothetical protein